jgi:glutathione S-transferase
VLRLLRFPYSTNVDRVALALAHKGLEVESVWIDPADRSPVEAISGQPLVPVLVDGDEVVADSTAILEHLEERHPDPPLYPSDPARRAEARIFVDWFNRVWKGPPNLLAQALAEGRRPGEPELRGWAEQIRGWVDWFEALLTGRAHLLGDDFGVADVAAWPFVRYALWLDDDVTDPFHHVIREHQRTTPERHPNLIAWIERVRERPMA